MRAEAYLRAQVDRDRVPGLQYVAVDAERVLIDCAVGHADLATGRAMTTDTTMMAYSMSKTITAIAVLQLVEAGLVELDAPLTTYLAEAPYGDRITVRQCLTHTAGVPNPIPLRWVHASTAHEAFDERAALAAVWRAHPRLAHEPGTRYAYSNIGYWMLGALIEQVSGEPFTAYVQTRILAPQALGLDALGYTIVAPERHATGYLERWSWADLLAPWLLDPSLLGPRLGRWRTIAPHYPNGPAFGGLVGTARAFGRFLQDQLQQHSVLLGDEARALLYRPQRTAAGRVVPMTLGWHVGTLDGVPCYFKEGGGGGFHALMRVYPTRGIGSVLMSNATRFDVAACLTALDGMLSQSPRVDHDNGTPPA